MIKRIFAAIAATITVSLAGVGILAGSASAAPQQFNITVQTDHRFLTGARLLPHEKLHVGLDGFAFTVTTEQFNGGGTVAWTDVAFPHNLIGKTFVVTVDGTS